MALNTKFNAKNGISVGVPSVSLIDNVGNAIFPTVSARQYLGLQPSLSGLAALVGGNSLGSALTIGTNDSYGLNLETAGSSRFTVTSAGNVGVATTAPTYLFSVKPNAGTAGQIGFSLYPSGAAPALYFETSNAGASYYMGSDNSGVLRIGNASYDILQSAGYFTNIKGNGSYVEAGNGSVTLSLDNSSSIVLSPNYSTNAIQFIMNSSIERMRITGAGLVGIGTIAPSARLDIADSTLAGSGALSGSILNLAQTWNTTGNPTAIKLNVTNTNSGAASNLLDLQVGSVSRLSVNNLGGITTGYRKLKYTAADSANYFEIEDNVAQTLTLWPTGELRWSNNTIRLYSDTYIVRDAANTLALRNGVSTQTFRLYNTYSNATTFERLNLRWDTNTVKIGTEKGSGGGLARDLAFETDASTRMTVSSGGNVGIGTIYPTERLNVVGNVRAEGNLSVYNLNTAVTLDRLTVDGSQGRLFTVTDALTGSLLSVNDISGLPILEVFDDDRVIMGEYASNALAVVGRNVGIGTASPSQKLTVVGVISSTNVIYASGGNSNAWNSAYTSVNTISANGASTYTTVNANSANWTSAYTSITAISGNNASTYTTVNANSANWSSVYTTTGTNSAKWDSAYTTTNTNSANWSNVYSTVNSNSANYILDGGNTKGANLLVGTNDNFNLNLETAGTTKMTVTSAGNVGIGTTSPTGKLTIDGSIVFTGTASRTISAQPATSAGTGPSITIRSGDASSGGAGGDINLVPGVGQGGPGSGQINLGSNTLGLAQYINLNAYTTTINSIGPNTGTPLTINGGGRVLMSFNWDNINNVTLLNSSVSSSIRLSGALDYQISGSNSLSSRFALNVSNSSGTSISYFRNDGNVGIGTITPTARLDVADTTLAGSGALSGSALSIAQTWNTTGNPNAITLNVTNSASGASSNLIDLQVGGISKFKVDKNGATTMSSALLVEGGQSTLTSSYLQLANSAGRITFNSNIIHMQSATGLGWFDLPLWRDAANTLAQRNSTNAQAFRLYNTYTDTVSAFERLNIKWESDVAKIGTEKGSNSGSARDLVLETNAAERLRVLSTGNIQVKDSLELNTLAPGVGAVKPVLTIYRNGSGGDGSSILCKRDGGQEIGDLRFSGTASAPDFGINLRHNYTAQSNLATFTQTTAGRGSIIFGTFNGVNSASLSVYNSNPAQNMTGINLGNLSTSAGSNIDIVFQSYTADPHATIRGIYPGGTKFGSLAFLTANGLAPVEALRITQLGNVGIGTSTPTANLQVNQSTLGTGTISISAAGTTVTGVNTQFLNTFKAGDTITSAGQTLTISSITSDTLMTTTSASSTITAAAYTLVGGSRFGVSGNGDISLGAISLVQRTANIDGVNANRLLATGNFGFGGGGLMVRSSTVNNSYRLVVASANSSLATAAYLFGLDGSQQNKGLIYSRDDATISLINGSGGNSDTYTKVLNITQSENVGIGTITPNEKLTVVGAISSTNVVYASGGNSNLWNSAYSSITAINASSASTFTTVNANSANWGGVFTTTNANSANWSSVYSSYNTASATIHNGTVTSTSQGNITIPKLGGVNESITLTNLGTTGSPTFANLTVSGSLSVVGDFTYLDTAVSVTSALSVVNTGTGPALVVRQSGTTPIAHFIDADGTGDIIFENNGFVGLGVASPGQRLTVAGNISSSSVIYASGGNSNIWNSTYTSVNTNSANSASVYTTTNTNSANWSSVYTLTNSNSANWSSVYTTTNTNSAGWASAYTTTNTNSAKWNSDYTTVNTNSANWSSVYSTTNTNSAKWDSTYSTVNTNSANYILDGGNTKGANILVGTNDNFNLNLETAGTTRMTVTSAGNVGIGTTTPGYKLDVNGTSRLGGNVIVDGDSLTMASAGWVQTWGLSYGGATTHRLSTNYDLELIGGVSTRSVTIKNGATETARFTDGRVGIGTITPTARLDIADTTLAGSGALSGSALSIAQTWNTTGNPTAITLNVTNSASGSTSNLLDLQVGGSSMFKMSKLGELTLNSSSSTTASIVLGGYSLGNRPTISNGGQNGFAFIISSANIMGLNQPGNGGLTLADGVPLNWSSNSTVYLPTVNVSLIPDGAGILAQRNGANAQTFRVYNTYTDASNYERGYAQWSSNAFIVGYEFAGTGNNGRIVVVRGSSSGGVRIDNGANIGFEVRGGNFLALLDNTYDIGASGATRPRNLYVGSSITAGTHVIAGTSGYLYISNRTAIGSPAAGVHTLLDSGGTFYNRLQFGGQSSAFPSIKRNGAALQIRLADDSANAALETANLTAIGAISSTNVVYASGGNSDLWNSAYTSVNTISGNGASTFTTVNANSASWSSVYTTTNANSAKWDSTHSTTNTLSSTWQSGYTTTNTNSAKWNSDYTTVNTNSANWSSVYTTVNTNSASYIVNGGNTLGGTITIGTNDANNFNLETSGTARVSISSTGQVGIGTTTPDADLVLYKNVVASPTTLKIRTATGTGSRLDFYRTDAYVATRFDVLSTNEFQFYNNNDVVTPKYIINGTNGNFGIGTTSTAQKVTIGGSLSASGSLYGERAILGDTAASVYLERDAINALGIRNSTAAQTLNVYGTYTSGTNFERLTLAASSLGGVIGHYAGGGGGVARDLLFQTSNATRMTIAAAGSVNVAGHFSAATKSFLIDHPTQEGKKLQYGVVESNQHSVLVRGKTSESIIELPEEWSGLVHEDSVTVQLTPIGSYQQLYVVSQDNQRVVVGGSTGKYNYTIYGERKDVDKLQTVV